MDFDLGRRGSIKSKMLESFLSNSPLSSSSMTRSSSSKCSYKSSKQVVTSKGSKIAVFESEKESFVQSETVGDETKTESTHAEAERFCEMEKDETDFDFSKDMHSIMGVECGAIMDKPRYGLLPESDDEEVFDEELKNDRPRHELECKFGLCPDGQPCACLDDCEINEEESSHFEEEYDVVSTMDNVKLSS